MHDPLLRLPPLDPLRGFVAAARQLSFTRAAEDLCLTQSAISRQVQTLENALGVPLFVRGVRTLSLTEQGARLAASAEGWLHEYAALANALRDPLVRPVTISTTIGIAALWLIPRLTRFQERHPDIDVRIDASNRVVDLSREDIDLVIRYCADRDAPPHAERLFGECIVPVASPALAVRGLDRDTLPDSVLLDYDDARYPWLRWSEWLAAMGLENVRPRAVLTFSHYDQIIQAAMSGQGYALGRRALVSGLIAESRLAVVGADVREVQGRSHWLIVAPGTQPMQVVRFVEWIREEAAQGR